jgi:hypothetical protein
MRAFHANEWGSIIQANGSDTRPSTADYGAAVTPGNNVYGSYAGIGAPSSDAYEVWISIHNGFVSAAARDILVTIGTDPTGGVSYSPWAEHLLGSCASPYGTSAMPGGVWYRFPVFVKSGTSFAAKASVNNATVGTVAVNIIWFCQPSRPDLLRTGSFIRTFGADTANSRGTLITPGTASKGSYVQLGSALVEPLWFWEFGMGINDATISGGVHHVDVALGDATTKKLAIANGFVAATNAEAIAKPRGAGGVHRQAAVGDLVYGRSQSGGTVDTDVSLIAYGVGG